MNPDDRRERPAESPEKKPYERPRILARESLQVVAAVCSGPGQKFPYTLGCNYGNFS